MILVDTDILSAFAKLHRLDALHQLLLVEKLHVTPAILNEISATAADRSAFARPILNALDSGSLEVVSPTDNETATARDLPLSLGAGEREAIAVAKARNGVVLSNESRVYHWCSRYGVPCVNLPAILRGLWVEGVYTQDEVRQIINGLTLYDRMSFPERTIQTIFAPKQ